MLARDDDDDDDDDDGDDDARAAAAVADDARAAAQRIGVIGRRANRIANRPRDGGSAVGNAAGARRR